MTQVSPVVEEMLEQVQRLQDASGAARTKMLGKRLHVTLGTVTNNLSRLQRFGLVKRVRYGGTRLTGEGRNIALRVLRRHRLLERLLTDILRVPWNKAHDAACRLEHSIDDDVTDAIENVLGHPKTCPHGNPIPSKSGRISTQDWVRLAELSTDDSGRVVRVLDEEEHGALDHVASMNLVPGAKFRIKSHTPFDGSVVLDLGVSTVTVSKKTASLLAVTKRGQAETDDRRV